MFYRAIPVILAAVIGASCIQRHGSGIEIIEEKMTSDCRYLDTIAENADPGRLQLNPKWFYDGQENVLLRAEKLRATHLVWLYNNQCGAAAMVYRCEPSGDDSPETAAAGASSL
jgi:hypothetical protein